MNNEHKSSVTNRYNVPIPPFTCTQCEPQKTFQNETLLSKHIFWAHNKNKIKILNRKRTSTDGLYDTDLSKNVKQVFLMPVSNTSDQGNNESIVVTEETTEKLIVTPADNSEEATESNEEKSNDKSKKSIKKITKTPSTPIDINLDIFSCYKPYARTKIRRYLFELENAFKHRLSKKDEQDESTKYCIHCCKCNSSISIND
jgi:hypothetical protein